MDLSHRLRISLAATLAVVTCAAVSASSATAAHPLKPDLVTLKLGQGDLVMQKKGKKGKKGVQLRLTNEVGNRGEGPLEVYPDQDSEAEPCEGDARLEAGRYAFQRIFTDGGDHNGEFNRDIDPAGDPSEAGCMQFHPPHGHWHVLDFAEYTLLDEQTGKPATSGKKAGFCVFDGSDPFPDLPVEPEDRYYTAADCSSSSSSPPLFEGISVGFSDIYTYNTPGQGIKVSGLDKGKYCLTSEADPTGTLAETIDDNNTAEARIRMNPKKLKVKKLRGDCAATR